MIYIIYLITGLLAGIIGGLLGTGGCALMMPVIRFGFNFDPAFAGWAQRLPPSSLPLPPERSSTCA